MSADSTRPSSPSRAPRAGIRRAAARPRAATGRRERPAHRPHGLVLLYTPGPAGLAADQRHQDAGRTCLDSFGLWFGGDFALWDNIARQLTYDDGIFLRWFANTLLYVVLGAGGATFLATSAATRWRSSSSPASGRVRRRPRRGRRARHRPRRPTFLMFSKLGLTNTPWAVIIPSLISPFGLYLMWIFAADAVPTELLEAARIDGAGELRTFFTSACRCWRPASSPCCCSRWSRPGTTTSCR